MPRFYLFRDSRYLLLVGVDRIKTAPLYHFAPGWPVFLAQLYLPVVARLNTVESKKLARLSTRRFTLTRVNQRALGLRKSFPQVSARSTMCRRITFPVALSRASRKRMAAFDIARLG